MAKISLFAILFVWCLLFSFSLAFVRPSYCDGSIACQTNIDTLKAKGVEGFSKNDEMLAYVKVNQGNLSAAFFPLTDEFSLLEVKKSWTALNPYTKPQITVEVQGVSSDSIVVKDGDKFLTQITVLVNVVQGKVTSLSWDYGCSGCSAGVCLNEFCGFSANTMKCSTTPDNCVLKIFLGFYGTDLNDMPLTSAGKRLSLFRSYGANWAVNEVIKLTRSVVPTA